MTSALTLNIGVTGHRDIPNQDIPKLEKAIAHELLALQKRYPNTTINMLCGLAEGADQLAAKIALQHNFSVIAVLPFAQTEYEKDFTDPQALSEFKQLLKRCSETKICRLEEDALRDDGYVELGRTLVRCCDIVFALWDGLMEPGDSKALPGGTADVVSMCVEGIMDDTSLLFSKPNQTYCKWLVSNRDQHESLPATIRSPEAIGTWQALPIKGNQDELILEDIFAKIERFNHDAAAITQEDKDKSVAYLLGSVEAKDKFASIRRLIDTYSLADCLAQVRQKQRTRSLKFITILSFIAIMAQQVYVGLYATLFWFVVQMVLVLVVILIYRVFFSGTASKEVQFVEWRVFAENLRVQIFWHIAGISEDCANKFRTTKLNEMDWIVDNLNKLTFNVDAPTKCDIELTRTHWLADQRDYFYGQQGKTGRAAQQMIKSRQYKKSSLVLFILAMLLMIFSAIKIELKLLPQLTEPILFIVIALLFIGSALLKTFSVQMGFEELSLRYLRTGYFFQQALNRMSLLDKKRAKNEAEQIKKYQNVIKVIGVEALNENAAWLQLHKMNAYQVQVN